MRRLTRKADVSAETRLLTSIYLAPEEFALLARLPGERLRKTRHRLAPVDGVTLSVDRFEGPLEGLILAEAEFETAAALVAFPMPDFAVREVTDDPRYAGGALIRDGLPA
jgi:CYTH domain-containing protein